MVIRLSTPVPFTSKDRVAYQTNGKMTMSKEIGNKHERLLSRYIVPSCLLNFKTKHPYYFKKQTPTLSKTSFKLENIFKRSTLFIHSYERESLQSFPKRWHLYKILSKTTPQSTFQNKSK